MRNLENTPEYISTETVLDISVHKAISKTDKSVTESLHFPIHIPPQLEEMALPTVTDDDFMLKLDSAVAPYMDLWSSDARKEQAVYYQNIHKRFDYAQQKCVGMTGRIEELKALNLGEEVTPEIRKLENLRRPYLTITRSVPAQFTREEDYLAHIMPQVEEDFKKNLAQVAAQCREMGLHASDMQVACTVQKNKGMSLSVSDGQHKGFEALITITKGSSIQRIPHVRCHTSELKTHRTRQTDAVEELDETVQKPLYDKLMDTRVMADSDLKNRIMSAHTVYYNKLWEKLPFARQRQDELQKEIALLSWADNPKARSLKRVLDSFKPLLNSVAASYERVDAYLAYQDKAWDGQMQKVVSNLTDKVADKGLDTETTRIKSLDMSNGMVQMTLCDKRGQELDIKLVVGGADSISRPPMVYTKFGEVRNVRQTLDKDKTDNPRLVSLQDAAVSTQQPAADYRSLVTKAKILEYNDKMFVTCHIGGVRMIPERIRPEEWKKYINSPGSDKTALAAAHYPKEIQRAISNLNNGQDTGCSRSRKI